MWTSTKIVDTTPFANAAFTSTTIGTGGVPGDYRETSHTWSDGTIIVAHLENFQQHQPAYYNVCKIDFAADLIHFTGATVGGAVSYRLCILQNGSYYGGPSIDVFSQFWASYVQPGLLETDFTLYAGGGGPRPDFSCTGAPMMFGFLTGNSATGGPVTKVSGIDNWSVTVHIARKIFEDGTLADADWTSTKLVDTTPGAGALTSSMQVPTGGAPGSYRETSHTWQNGVIIVVHLTRTSCTTPRRAIYSIHFRIDANHSRARRSGRPVGLQCAVRPRHGVVRRVRDKCSVRAGCDELHAGLTRGLHVPVRGSGPPLSPDVTSNAWGQPGVRLF
jgi:hypothetical protein